MEKKHEALALKHRPQKIADLVGQDHVTRPLTRALESGRIHPAYLFTGSRGCGKTSSARILAMSLNCQNSPGPTATPCGTCTSCTDIREKRSLDVVEIDAAGSSGVDDARELAQRASAKPGTSRYKVFILDECHMMSPQAFNALLTTIESPPPYVRFIFCTTEPEKVITTIKSRSFRYNFRLVTAKKMVAHLSSVLSQEGIKVADEVLPLVARAGGGSVRDALTALDQLISGTGGDDVSVEDAAEMLGLTSSALLEEAVEGILARDASALFGLVDKVVEGGTEVRRFSADLLERLRDLVVLKTVPDALERSLVGPYLEQEEAVVVSQAQRIQVPVITRVNDAFTEAYEQMGKAKDQRLVLEMAMAKLVSGDTDRLVRVEQMLLELLKRPAGTIPTAPAPVVAEAPQELSEDREEQDVPEAQVAEEPEAPAITASTNVMRVEVKPMSAPENPDSWGQVVEAATTLKKAAGAVLKQSTVTSMEGSVVKASVPSAGMLSVYEKNRGIAEEALKSILGPEWSLVVSVAS